MSEYKRWRDKNARHVWCYARAKIFQMARHHCHKQLKTIIAIHLRTSSKAISVTIKRRVSQRFVAALYFASGVLGFQQGGKIFRTQNSRHWVFITNVQQQKVSKFLTRWC